MCEYRQAAPNDQAFIVEMARQASVIEDRPLPAGDSAEVLAILPSSLDTVVIGADGSGRPLGAAWWHWHEPPLLCDDDGSALPEMIVAVAEDARGRGIGTGLVAALCAKAATRYDALALNVHLRNRAAGLYTRTGFRVAGAGRGSFGVAMRRDLVP